MKLVTLSVACLLALGAVVPATARPGSGRSLSYDYQGGDAFIFDNLSFFVSDGDMFREAPRSGERFITVEVVDDSGRPVMAAAHQANEELGQPFCGKSDRLRLITRKPVHVHLITGPGCDDISIPTEGTVTLTFEG